MCACMPFFPAVFRSSPTLQKCLCSVQSLASWTRKSSSRSSASDSRRSYQKHVGHEGSGDGLALQGRESFTEVILRESPTGTHERNQALQMESRDHSRHG